MSEHIQLGDLALTNHTAAGHWNFDQITGWHDGASVRLNQVTRLGHGEFSQQGLRGSRVVTISGWFFGANRADAAEASDRLVATLADGSFARLAVLDPDLGERWAMVQLADKPDIRWDDGPAFRYQLTLLAPDGFRYGARSSGATGFATDSAGRGLRFPLFSPNGFLSFGPRPTSSGLVTVTNAGTAPASPLFTVEGPTPEGGFSITETATGDRITFYGTVPAGSTLVLDPSDESVLIDGTGDRATDAVVARWPEVPAGSTATFIFAPEASTSTATLTVDVDATYW